VKELVPLQTTKATTTTTTTKTFINVSGVFSIAANWGHTQKRIMNVKMNKYILKKLISKY